MTTISHGSLRPQELIPTFLQELRARGCYFGGSDFGFWFNEEESE